MLTIDTARIFEPLLRPGRYKGAWVGRGSGKSHYMAGAVVEHCLLNPGSRIVCIRECRKPSPNLQSFSSRTRSKSLESAPSSAFSTTGS